MRFPELWKIGVRLFRSVKPEMKVQSPFIGVATFFITDTSSNMSENHESFAGILKPKMKDPK